MRIIRKRIGAILLAALCFLLLGTFSTVTAEAEGQTTGESSSEYQITITPPVNTPGTNTYSLYRIFDATVNADGSAVSYKMPEGKTLPAASTSEDTSTYTLGNYFEDQNGSIIERKNSGGTSLSRQGSGDHADWLNDTAVAAIARYVNENFTSPTYTVTTTGESQSTINVLPGYYYISTTTGTVVAVDTPHKTVEVKDKNEVPSIMKDIWRVKENASDSSNHSGGSIEGNEKDPEDTRYKNALAEVGSRVTFLAEVKCAKGSTGYVFKDKMDSSLKLDTSSIKVYIGGAEEAKNLVKATEDNGTVNYTLDTTPVADTEGKTDGYTFKITFSDALTERSYSGAAHLHVVYDAVVTSDALQTDPAINRATISWGHNQENTSQPITTHIYNAVLTVTKNFEGVDKAPYPVAGFVLRKGAGTTDDPYKYYKHTEASGDNSAKTEFVSIGTTSIADAIKNGTITEVRTTADSNQAIFHGLANADYTLIESTTPDGYNTAADSKIVIHGAGSDNKNKFTAENLIKTATVDNKKGALLPSTGGTGTQLFYLIGALLIATAGVGIVLKKRRAA